MKKLMRKIPVDQPNVYMIYAYTDIASLYVQYGNRIGYHQLNYYGKRDGRWTELVNSDT